MKSSRYQRTARTIPKIHQRELQTRVGHALRPNEQRGSPRNHPMLKLGILLT